MRVLLTLKFFRNLLQSPVLMSEITPHVQEYNVYSYKNITKVCHRAALKVPVSQTLWQHVDSPPLPVCVFV